MALNKDEQREFAEALAKMTPEIKDEFLKIMFQDNHFFG